MVDDIDVEAFALKALKDTWIDAEHKWFDAYQEHQRLKAAADKAKAAYAEVYNRHRDQPG